MAYKWTKERIDTLKSLHGKFSIEQIAAKMGTTKSSVRGMITREGIAKKTYWTQQEEEILRSAYIKAGEGGCVSLSDLARELGRNKGNVCRKAKQLGLSTNAKRKRAKERKPKERNGKFKSHEELKAFRSEIMRRRHQQRGHHMLGKRHSAEALKKMSVASKERWASMSESQKQEFVDNAYKAAAAKENFGAPKTKRGSWKAQWREVGGKRNFYRSQWEANYACYLQFLKDRGAIQEWLHEPETFWFEQIKRGTRSYKPDFRVWENNGMSKLHEVKGWMDQRSKTTLSRMKKYYPQEEIVLITQKEYAAIAMNRAMIPGWT